MMTKNDKLTIITPSFNQSAFIEQTIKSVQEQDYDNFEHIIIDGGSRDETVTILNRYSHLKWISEKDNGQADALNKGLARATGNILGWINSDDYYERNIFQVVLKHFSDPSTMWIVGNLSYVDEDGTCFFQVRSPEISYERLLRNPDIVRQPPTFFRRSFLERVGGWDRTFSMVMDLDLWIRLAKLSTPKMLDENIAYFRVHSHQKTSPSNMRRQTREICRVLRREGVPWHGRGRVCLKKQWQAFKAYSRMLLVYGGFARRKQDRDLVKSKMSRA